MPYPTLRDDGGTVTLDLHGATVAEAVRLAKRTLAVAAARGRSQVKLIHGTSTSDRAAYGRTIKHALLGRLDDGTLSPHVASDWRADGYVLCALTVTGGPADPTPLRLSDL